ncbi:MAG: pseudouridine synthase [Candidatus Peregrinibacteria bacterium]
MLERLQKILSARGIASRRKAEEYILAGLVKVNGVVAILGQKADPESDLVEVDGEVMKARQEMLYYVMHKPVGVVTTNIEGWKGIEGMEGLKGKLEPVPEAPALSVRDILPKNLQGKIYPVGRLDKDSEGLLLFTNDGVLAYRLTHPKFDHEKEYEVTVADAITEGQLKKIREGVRLFDEMTKPAVVRRIGPRVFSIAITEGRNRQIRRMVQKVGGEVTKLVRTRIMTLQDSELAAGKIRPLLPVEKAALLSSVGL